MATKKVSKIQKTADNLKVQAKQIHDSALEASDNLVESSIVTGERWQKLMAKALKDGTVLFGKQQDMMLDTLETLKGQYLNGNGRLRKLLGIKAPSFKKAVEDVAKPTAAKVKDTSLLAKELAKAGIKKAKKAVTGKKASAQKSAKATASKAKATATKPAAPKRKVTSKKTAPKATADQLTKIEGIGPKIEQILNDAGIRTFKMLSTVDAKSLKTILAKAGPRYKMHNPKTWRQQAKLAANGKWDKLTDLQKELKGGVKVKKK